MGFSEYKYTGLPLTPAICKGLIVELFNGRIESRKTIVNEVLKTHLERGGKETKAVDKSRMLKKALEILKSEGIAKNPSRGYWKIIDKNYLVDSEKDVSNNDVKEVQDNEVKEVIKVAKEVVTEKENAGVVLGNGSSAVYLYYLPGYHENRKKDTWPCKIGKTDGDAYERIISQVSTALPEKPRVAVIIKTDNSHALEQAVHNILNYRNKKIESALGKEWFDTNPDEFLRIVQFIEESTLLF
ncbi:GIY-YIG nuclease family protein [Guptibacillus spartinae]|uniref:GIY-YIG nuclease family protein n=1 Tax=Guptibacillus spartinae TaxID=3025679 RepID=UPI00235F0EE4|nr:GIY-YIG nuclease family protein [Pseudalkalibacillus spartinae]